MRITALLNVASTLVAAAVIAALVFAARLPAIGSGSRPVLSAPFVSVPEVEFSLATTFVRGAPNARWVLIEFGDYECSACGLHAREVFPKIVREFVDAGILKYVFLSFPRGDERGSAFRAGEAAECAGSQNVYWPMHDLLFRNPDVGNPAVLLEYVTRVGGDRETFQQCLQSTARGRVTEHIALAKRFRITATPTFLLGRSAGANNVTVFGKAAGAPPYEVFRTVLQTQMNNAN